MLLNSAISILFNAYNPVQIYLNIYYFNKNLSIIAFAGNNVGVSSKLI